MDKATLKRVLAYVRRRKTDIHKEYVKSLSERNRGNKSLLIEGRLKTYSECIAYLEKLLREVEESEAVAAERAD
ncbi:MAG: hypothetical protein MJA29_02895 [Candidatus Omnitrophica bacterium]|nr:hypothetical protein [Candidatus Omnitrophota bacterium]